MQERVMQERAADLEARLRRDPALREEGIRQDSLVYGGLIAGCIALMQPFISAPPGSLDLSAVIAVLSFSVAIPLLAALLMVSRQEVFRHRPTGLRLLSVTKVVGQGLAVFGIAAAFWHVSWIAGVAILATALVAVIIHSVAWIRLEGIDGSPEADADR